jgi:NTP pyrophosphatase (non-canonical NTP hydrolase)
VFVKERITETAGDSMTFDEYQNHAATTAIYPKESVVSYPVLGLLSEAGEIAGKVKKVIRDGNLTPNSPFTSFDATVEDVDGIAKEMGDCLWYLAALATDLGLDLEDVAKANLVKLRLRHEKGVLKGSGDDREFEIMGG